MSCKPTKAGRRSTRATKAGAPRFTELILLDSDPSQDLFPCSARCTSFYILAHEQLVEQPHDPILQFIT
jgi:hypothetical protein